MTLGEKDKYIREHLMKLTDETLRYMLADLHAEAEELEKENSVLKEELFDRDTVALMDKFKKYATENFRLKAEIKELKDRRFVRFTNGECWIFQGDGTDKLETLVCPVVIQPAVLNRIIEMAEPACCYSAKEC